MTQDAVSGLQVDTALLSDQSGSAHARSALWPEEKYYRFSKFGVNDMRTICDVIQYCDDDMTCDK